MTSGPATDDRIEVTDDAAGGFYELRVNGEFAGIVVYETFGSRRVLTHTTVQPEFRGRGLSWVMMQRMLDDLRARHLTVTNTCPVVDRYLQANPRYADLLDAGHPGTWPQRLPAAG
jgi:hypothetical protein